MNRQKPVIHEKTAQLVWTGIILQLFLIQAVIWTIAISITASDVSHAIIPDYDRAAMSWDQTRAEHRQSLELGWQARLSFDPDADIRSQRRLQLELRDSELRPIEQAVVEIDIFHCGHAAEVQRLTLLEAAPGTYWGLVRIAYPGHWQISGTATRQQAKFIIQQRHHLTIERKQ